MAAMEDYCARCKRPNPEAPDGLPVDWEVTENEAGEVIGLI